MMRKKILQEYLFDACERDSQAFAAKDGRRAVTFDQVQSGANRLARCLRSLGVKRGDRVVLSFRRSTDWLTAIQGTLCASAAYVPVDPEISGMRWCSILQDSIPSAIVVDHVGFKAAEGALVEAAFRVPVIVLEGENGLNASRGETVISPGQLSGFSSAPLDLRISAEDLAYIMYTSGSTGKPKGVMISHGNVINYIQWAVKHFRLGNKDKILGTAPFSFDMSTFDVHASLGAGATLLIAPDGMSLFPARLVGFMEKEMATVWKGVASLFMYISRVGALRKANLNNLRVVMFAGEALPVPYLVDWMKTLPETEFHNCYGPTETTGVSLSYRLPEIPSSGERIPIGVPGKEGMKAFLIDENGGEVPAGQVGEVLLAGPGLSKGYWNDKDKTKSAFFELSVDPGKSERVYRTGDLGQIREDGNLEFAGRKDRQVKIMGYRIELGEIEHHLMMTEGVEEAVALAVPSEGGEHNELVVFYTGPEELPHRLKEALGKSLPPYMVPKKIFRIEEFPRCPRGKISYKDLDCYPGEG